MCGAFYYVLYRSSYQSLFTFSIFHFAGTPRKKKGRLTIKMQSHSDPEVASRLSRTLMDKCLKDITADVFFTFDLIVIDSETVLNKMEVEEFYRVLRKLNRNSKLFCATMQYSID